MNISLLGYTFYVINLGFNVIYLELAFTLKKLLTKFDIYKYLS